MRLAAVVAAAVALAGCGGSADKPSSLSAAQRQGLLTRVEKIRAAATAHDVATTESRLRGFVREVARLRAANALSAPAAFELRTAAARAAARAKVEIPPAPTVATPTPAPAPTPTPAPAPKKKPGKGAKHGKPDKHHKGEGHD